MGCSKIRSEVVKKMIGDLRFGEEKVSSIIKEVNITLVLDYGQYSYPSLFPLSLIIAAIFVKSELTSGILGIVDFIFLWSIHKIFKQKKRVKKGRFPKNPKGQI